MAFLDNVCRRFLLTAALLAGCAREPAEDLPAAVATETARLVSTVTSGTVSSRGPVKVRFTKPVVDGSLLDHPLKKRVFAFTPRIDGTAKWESTRDLVFRPNRPLPARQAYRGRLDLAALLPDRPDLEPLDFDFIVAGREILSLEGDFDLRTAGDPKYLIYRGRLKLTVEAELDGVRRAATLRRGEDLVAPDLGGGRGGPGLHLHQRRHEAGHHRPALRLRRGPRGAGDLPPVREGDPPGSAAGDAAGEGGEGRGGRRSAPGAGVLRRAGPAPGRGGAGAGARGGGPPEGLGQGDPRGRGLRPRPRLRAGGPPRDPQPLGHPHRGSHAAAGRVLRPQPEAALRPRRRLPAVLPGPAAALRHPQPGPRLPGGEEGLRLQPGAVPAEREPAQRPGAPPPLLQRPPRRRAGRPRHPRDPRPAQRLAGARVGPGGPHRRGGTGAVPGGAALRPGGHALPTRRRRRGDPPALRPGPPPTGPGPRLLLRPDGPRLRPRQRPGRQGPDRQRHRAHLQARPRPAPRVRHPPRRRPAPARRRGDPAHLPEPGRRPGHHRRPRAGALRGSHRGDLLRRGRAPGAAQPDQARRHGLEPVDLRRGRRRGAPGAPGLHLYRARRLPARGRDQPLRHRPAPGLHLPRRPSRHLPDLQPEEPDGLRAGPPGGAGGALQLLLRHRRRGPHGQLAGPGAHRRQHLRPRPQDRDRRPLPAQDRDRPGKGAPGPGRRGPEGGPAQRLALRHPGGRAPGGAERLLAERGEELPALPGIHLHQRGRRLPARERRDLQGPPRRRGPGPRRVDVARDGRRALGPAGPAHRPGAGEGGAPQPRPASGSPSTRTTTTWG